MKPTDQTGEKAPTSRRSLNYWGCRVGIACGLLLILELILRFLPIGDSSRLVVTLPKSPGHFQVNAMLSGQWIPGVREIKLPELFYPAYAWQKPTNTRRIICLGDEITLGWPYLGHSAYPSQLRAMLQYTQPTVTWEVINAGVSGLNSTRLREILPDLDRLKPDVICLQISPGMLLMDLACQRSRSGVWLGLLYELKQRALFRLFGQIFHSHARTGAQEYSHLEHYRAVLEFTRARKKDQPALDFSSALPAAIESNLRQFLQECQTRQLSVILGQSGVNLLMPPVAATTSPESLRVNAALDSVQQLIRTGLFEKAQSAIQARLDQDSLAAQWHYLNGLLKWEQKEYQSAQLSFQQACDYTRIPWRQSQALNQMLEQLAREFQLPLVPGDSLLQTTTLEPRAGNAFFVDALHPNWEGQHLLAQGFLEKIRPQFSLASEKPLPQAAVDSLKNTNLLDQYVGEISIQMLNRGPACMDEKKPPTVPPFGDEILWKLGMRVVRQPELWLLAHQEAAHEWAARRQFTIAARHYLAPALFDYTNFTAYHNLGYFYERHGDFLGAAQAYRHSAELNSGNPKLLTKVGNMFAMANQFQTGISFLEAALEMYQQRRYSIKNTDLIAIQLSLVEAYLATQQSPKARQQLQAILALEPNQFQARKLLQKLESAR